MWLSWAVRGWVLFSLQARSGGSTGKHLSWQALLKDKGAVPAARPVCATIENSLIRSSPPLAVSASLWEQEARSLLRADFPPRLLVWGGVLKSPNRHLQCLSTSEERPNVLTSPWGNWSCGILCCRMWPSEQHQLSSSDQPYCFRVWVTAGPVNWGRSHPLTEESLGKLTDLRLRLQPFT